MTHGGATAIAGPAAALPALGSLTLTRVVLIAWASWSIGRIIVAGPAIAAGQLGDTDDFMRLAEWRDFLAGQNWFDLHQHRFPGPDGGAMHFSRLPDMLMSILFWLMSPLIGADAAERTVLLVYPPLLLLPFLGALGVAAKRLAGNGAGIAAIALALLAAPMMHQFTPGRIDHHGLALTLSMVSLAAILMANERPMAGAVAAIATILGAVVTLETAPTAAAAPIAIGLIWIATGEYRALRIFGTAMLIGAPVLLFGTLGAAAFSDAHCDAYAAPAALALTATGLAASALSFIRVAGARWRFVLALAAGGAVAAITFATYPHCLGGPFAGIDPLVREVWLSSVSEVQSPADLLAHRPGAVIEFCAFPIIAFGAGVWLWLRWRGADRLACSQALAFAVCSMLMLFFAVRGASLAAAFVIPPLSAVLARGFRNVSWSPPRGAARFVALCLLVSPLPYTAIGDALNRRGAVTPSRAATATGAGQCDAVSAVRALRTLPPSILFTEIDLGPLLLANTGHSVTAAPYHRNSRSMRRTIEFYTLDDESARAILAASGADYLVFCPSSSETNLYASRAPGGVAAQLKRGATPNWLVPVKLDGAAPIRLYRRVPA